MNIGEIRKQYPQYNDLSDEQLARGLHDKFYSDIPFDDYAERIGYRENGRTIGGTIKDVGVSLGKGLVGVSESALGLTGLASDYISKILNLPTEMTEYPKDRMTTQESQQELYEKYSEPQKRAFEEVEKGKGFIERGKRMITHPSTIGHAAIESAPAMFAGGGVGGGLVKMGVAPLVAGAIGEGLVSAGQTAHQIREESPEKELTAKQKGAVVASGALTSLISVIGGRMAKKLGIADPDTLYAKIAARWHGGASSDTVKRNILVRMAAGGLTEGFLEEMPQSVQEQFWLNAATGRPLTEGLGEAGAEGALVGFGMGAGHNIFTGKDTSDQGEDKKEPTIDREKILTGLVNNDLTIKDLADLKEGMPPEDIAEIDAAIQAFEQGRPNVPEIKTEPIQEVETVKELFPKQTPEEQAQIEKDIMEQREGKTIERMNALASLWGTLSETEKKTAAKLIVPSEEEAAVETERKAKEQKRDFTKTEEIRKVEQERKAKEQMRFGKEEKPQEPELVETGRWEELDADRIREETRQGVEAARQKEMVEGEEEPVQVRDTEGYRVETEQRKKQIPYQVGTKEQGEPQKVEKREPEKPMGEVAEKVSSEKAEEIKSFRTAKGSAYTVNEDGTTTRDKAPRPEHPGKHERGIQPKSKKTWYVTEKDIDKLSIIQTRGGDKIGIGGFTDGRIAAKYITGENKGKFIKNTIVSPSTTPKKGLYPVEYWGDDRTIHFGNKIVEIEKTLTKQSTDDLSQINTGTPKDDDSSDKEPRKGTKGFGKLAVNEFGEVGGRGEITTGTSVRYKRGKYNVEEIENGRAIISNARGEKIVNLSELSVWSKRLPSQAPTEKRAIGKAWIRNQQRPIIDAYEFKRGRNKGNYRVTLPDGSKKIVERDGVKFEEQKPSKQLTQITKTLKDETGSSEIANDIYRKAAELINSGVNNIKEFTSKMQDAFPKIWDKIKKHIKALWDIVSNQRGEITIGKKPTEGMTKERRAELMKRYVKTPQVKQKEKIDKQLHEDTVDSINEINRVSKTKAIWKFIRPGKLTRQGKKDLSYMWDLMLSVPEYFKQKIGAVKRIYQAQQDRMDEYHEHVYQTENHDKVNVVQSFKRLKKQSRKAYRKVKDYLVETDKTGSGFRIGKDNDKWTVYDPKKNIVKEFDSKITEDGTDSGEVKAVEEMVQAEAKNLSEQGFTPEQIEAVTAFRLTTNKGFELLFRAMRNLRAKFREAGLPEPTIETWEAGEKQSLTLEQAMAQMGDMRGVYFPRIRPKGRFVLTAVKGDDKILRTFNLQNTMSVVKSQLESQGYKVETGKNRQLGEDVFELSGDLVKTQQILTAAIEKAEKVLSGPFVEGKTELTESVKKLNQDFQRVFEKAVAEQVANIIRGRGSRVHMTKRNPEVWTGYEEDPQIAIAKYIRGLAGGEAKRNASMKMLHAFTGTDISWNEFKEQENLKGRKKVEYEEYIKFVRERMISGKEQPNAFKWAKAYISEMTRNREMADEVIGFVKGVAVGKYLAFRVLSAPLVNITALPTSVVATLKGAGIPYAQSWKYLGKGLANYGKYIRYMRTNKTDDFVFKTIKEKGWDNPQFSSESIQTLRSQLGRGWDKIIDLGMFTFSESERLNRVATIYAAYHGLKAQNPNLDNETLLERAKELSDKSHGVYNKGNHPYIALGNNPAAKLAQMFYVFRTFSHTYLLNMRRLGLDKQWGAVAHMVLAPAVIAGAGASVMTPIISGLLKMFGFDEPEEELYKYIGENWNPEAEQWARFGLAGAGGGGVSIKGSLAIGIGDLPTRIEDLFGAPGSIGKDIYYGAKSLKRGDVSKGVEKLTPTGFGNLLRAYREYNEGLTTWNNAPKFYGTERLKASKFEAFMRGFSLNPARLAGISEQQWKERKVEEKYRQWRTDIYAKIKRFYLSGGTDEEWAELIGLIENFNDRAARWNLSPITAKSIRMNIKRSFKPSKRERMRQ